jgi:hypothetical protein
MGVWVDGVFILRNDGLFVRMLTAALTIAVRSAQIEAPARNQNQSFGTG